MRYADGELVAVGDRVCMGGDREGVVVADITKGEFSQSFLKENWSYLGEGILVNFTEYGLIHMLDVESDMELIARLIE